MLHKTLNIKGTLTSLDTPLVMGILNVTPDSFYADSRKQTEAAIEERIQAILSEGGQIIDLGGYSSRPDAAEVPPEEEMERLAFALKILNTHYSDVALSVDTFRADVARRCVEEYGVAIINDISGGELDAEMFETVARLHVPYIMMHMRGTPQTMRQHTDYADLMEEIMLYFARKVRQLRLLGVNDIILDPGFGFSKTVDQNYTLMSHLCEFKEFGLPLLVGVSRKSM
ncbi:dihydropteroate synthase, partial [Parabacteroides johnsonii]